MTALRFPSEIAVGEVWWEDALEPGGSGHLLATGVVEVPDGTAVTLEVSDVAEVSVSNQRSGLFLFTAPAGTARPLAGQPGPVLERVTWRRGMPDGAPRNNRSIWGEPGESHSIEHGEESVDLEFIRSLPADSVFELSLTDVDPSSFTAVAHLAPGLRGLGLFLDDYGEEAPSVIAELTALESLRLYGNDGPDDGPSLRLDDHALSAIADLPALEYLALLGGSYTEHGLQQLRHLPRLRHLHIEREGLTVPMFRFATAMPALARLTGLDEFGDDGPMAPGEVDQVRAMLPHINMD